VREPGSGEHGSGEHGSGEHGSGEHGAGTSGFAGTSQALATARSALAYVAAADAGSLPDVELAECLKALELVVAAQTAARSRILAAFHARGVFEDDGARSAKSWLVWQTGVTKAAAGGAIGWMKRLAVHPQIASALAAAAISESWARQLCEWSDRLPPDVRTDADQIFLDAAADGLDLAGLSALAEQMYARTCGPDQDGDDEFTERSMRLDLHWRGHGRLTGQLTPECAAALSAVLDALGKRAGPEDDRTSVQRDHDALEEACRRLVAGGLPDAAGQPTSIQLHMTLSQLRDLARDAAADGGDGPWAEDAWLSARGTAAGTPGWLPGSSADAYACDAAITPVVTGMINPDSLDRLVAQLAAARPAGCCCGGCPRPVPGLSGADRTKVEDLVLRAAAEVLSGPGGLASYLRTRSGNTRLARPSLPLDVGQTDKIPAHLRRLVAVRHPHCAFPGCGQPARHCQVHHLIPRSEGGPTALQNLVPLCAFHHLIATHRWGWTLALNPDGTTTATSPDRTRVLHSHSPPAAAAA
jgi:uncharacterized protein DUF222/HNH endonuclease